jgi:hypothetical protein
MKADLMGLEGSLGMKDKLMETFPMKASPRQEVEEISVVGPLLKEEMKDFIEDLKWKEVSEDNKWKVQGEEQ